MKASDIRTLKWIIELFIIAFAVITFSHTVWFGGVVFEGADPELSLRNRALIEGVLYAFGLDIGMVFAAYSIGKSNYLPFTISMGVTFIINLSVSIIAQLYYTFDHTGAVVTPYWEQKLVPIMDAVPVIAPASLGLIATSFVISQMILSQYQRSYEGVTSSITQTTGEFYYPQKTKMKTFSNAREMLESAQSYYGKKHGQRFLEEKSDELVEWLSTQSGKLWLDTDQGRSFRKSV